jgi:hypothetical protein
VKIFISFIEFREFSALVPSSLLAASSYWSWEHQPFLDVQGFDFVHISDVC